MALDPQIQSQIASGVSGLVSGLLLRDQQKRQQQLIDEQESDKLLSDILKNQKVSNELKNDALSTLIERRGLGDQLRAEGFNNAARTMGIVEQLLLQQGNPQVRQQALGAITGQMQPEDIQFSLSPERQALVRQREESAKVSEQRQELVKQQIRSSKALESKRRDAISKINKGGQQSLPAIRFIANQAQARLSQFDNQVSQGLADPNNPPPSVIQARRDLESAREAAIKISGQPNIGRGSKKMRTEELIKNTKKMTTQELINRRNQILGGG